MTMSRRRQGAIGRRRGLRLIAAVLIASAPSALSATSYAATNAALWHMDDASVMTDDSGNGNDGTPTDVTLVTPGYDGSGGAYSFNGTSSLVVVADSDSLDPGNGDITITVHVKFSTTPDQTVGDYDLVRKKQAAVQYKMEIISGGRALCVFGDGGTRRSITMKRNLADGDWHTIACTKTTHAVVLTVDGRSKTKSVTIGSISNSADVILGGKDGSSGDWYSGLMDEVSISIG